MPSSSIFLRHALLTACVLWGSEASASLASPSRQDDVSPVKTPPFRDVGTKQGLPVVKLRPETLARAKRDAAGQVDKTIIIEGFPVRSGEQAQRLDLRLEEFRVTTPETRFVIGSRGNQADRPSDFDPSSITFLRGSVDGYPASHVVMAIGAGSSMARIDLGPGHPRYMMSTRGTTGVPLEAGEMVVFPSRDNGNSLAPAHMCGVNPARFKELVVGEAAAMPGNPRAAVGPRGGGGDAAGEKPSLPNEGERGAVNIRGMRELQLAVDTDYELYELFGDTQAAMEYVVQVYAVVSDIYIRDVNTRVVLSFVRIWDTPMDLFNTSDPLSEFRTVWNTTMGAVTRDAAQLLTGRRDLSAGGVAYVSALCTQNAYSWSGYTLGFFGDPDNADWANRDIMIPAHELGHNCGTLHTHDYNLDTCDEETSTPRRGSIMSYCGQTYSGGDANHDLWFHERTAQEMRNYIATRMCVIIDCNANGIADNVDISLGMSRDVDRNSVPDECDDCNGNGTLDPQEIALGAPDVNANGVIDSCEPDCNGNQIPDAYETNQNPAIDLNRNRIPDSCEGDRNSNGLSDYNEIQADMTLDINRNVMLDSTEDCDADGTPDLAELDHAWNCYIGSAAKGSALREYFGETGVQMNAFGSGVISDVQDFIITADRRILISSGGDNVVREFDEDGNLVRVLVAPAAGGLSFPTQMLVSRADPSKLLLASKLTDQVLEFNLADGSFVRALVSGADAPDEPFGMAFGPNGNLFVTSIAENSVREYDAATGAFVRVMVDPAANGGLEKPYGLLFKPDGNLLVCSWHTGAVLEYNGQTGAFLRQWTRVGTQDRLTLDNPWCIRLGPDGDVYVSRSHTHRSGGGPGGPEGLHLTNARVYHFDIRNGNFVRAYLQGVDSALSMPTGFDFMPGDVTDCNQNWLPDVCDVSSGYSQDCNGNGAPDECDIRAGMADINHDGVPDSCQCLGDWNDDTFVNSQDFFDFLTAFFAGAADFNASGATDSQDFFDFLTYFFEGC